MGIIKLTPYFTISGKQLYNMLQEGSLAITNLLEKKFAEYDKTACIALWSKFIWHLDEFINIFFELDPINKGIVLNTPIGWNKDAAPEEFKESISIINDNFGKEVADRFVVFISLFDSIPVFNNFMPALSIEQLLEFCMSRRLHYVSIIYLLSKYANGNKKVSFSNAVTEFQHYVENYLMLLTTGYHAMIQSMCLPDFHAKCYSSGVMIFSEEYSQLDDNYLEPQILSYIDIINYSHDFDRSKLRDKPNHRLYSIEEYDVMLHNDDVTYDYYELSDSPTYRELYNFFRYMIRFFIDGYHIEVNEEQFQQLRRMFPTINPYSEHDSVYDIQNTRYAFYRVDNTYYSNFFLLQRFYQNAVQRMLKKSRRFRIKAGFIFEKMVSDVVEKYGFKNQNITRINHKEFDVVCVKNNVIYNFQCKNNFFDVTQIDIKNVARAVRYNKYLTGYYNRSLNKEAKKEREDLLKERLEIQKIEHYVISRFPVITNNERVIPFNQLESRLPDLLSS